MRLKESAAPAPEDKSDSIVRVRSDEEESAASVAAAAVAGAAEALGISNESAVKPEISGEEDGAAVELQPAGDSIIENRTVDDVITMTAADNDEEINEAPTIEEEKECHRPVATSTRPMTNLQQRCIMALRGGDEVEMLLGQGSKALSDITTSPVIEELLYESVVRERSIRSGIVTAESELLVEQRKRVQEQETSSRLKKKLDLNRKHLEEEAMKWQEADRDLKRLASKLEDTKKAWADEKKELHKELELARARAAAIERRQKAREKAHAKKEDDCEMYELSIKEINARLEAMAMKDEWLMCGSMASVIGPLMMLINASSDRRECEEIRTMLTDVINDPSSYERNYLSKIASVDMTKTFEPKDQDSDDDGTIESYEDPVRA